MALMYLDFDYGEDADGNGTFDAIASAPAAQALALKAEVASVLGWAHGHWPGGCAPLEDGGAWHYDLHGVEETSTPVAFDFDTEGSYLHATHGAPLPPRTTVHFTVTGSAAFCAAFRAAFVDP